MSWQTLYVPDLCSRLCLSLAHSLWQSAILAAVAVVASKKLLRSSVQTSYLVHVFALTACLMAVPVTFAMLPSNPTKMNENEPTAPQATSVAGLASSLGSNRDMTTWDQGRALSQAAVAPNDQSGMTHQLIAWHQVTVWFSGLYAVGVAAMLIRLTLSVAAAERLRRSAHVINTGAAVLSLRQLATHWHLRVAPILAQAEGIIIPAVVGLLRPTILLPAAALTGLTQDELGLILAHELAHIRRGDMWVNLLQRLVEVALFFNPVVWYLNLRIDAIREYCCDDLACGDSSTTNASRTAARLDYATALIRIVEVAQPALASQHKLAALAASGRSPSQLRRRVARLLGEPVSEPLWPSRGALLMGAMAIVVVCGPSLLVTRAQATKDTALVAQSGDDKDSPSTKAFSFGGKVEVLAIGTHDEDPQRWWNAEGQAIEVKRFAWSDDDNVSSPDKKWRRLIFQIHALPEGADIDWDIFGAQASAGGKVRFDTQPTPKNSYARYFSVADDRQTVDLHVGVATGSWTTANTISLEPMSVGGPGNKSIVSSGAIATAEGTALVVSHNYFDRNFRLVAIDKQNKVHDTAGRGGMSAGEIYQTRATFRGLSLDEIHHFEFQVRDYEWLDFKGLPLEPESTIREGGIETDTKLTPRISGATAPSIGTQEAKALQATKTDPPLPEGLSNDVTARQFEIHINLLQRSNENPKKQRIIA